MAHYAIICPDEAGHVLSVGALGSELIRRGHRATLIAGPNASGLAEQLNLDTYPLPTDDFPFPFPHVGWAAFSVAGAGWVPVLRSWLRWRTELALQFIPQALRDLNVDGALIDQTVAGGGSAAESAGVPFVTVCSALLWNEEEIVPPPFTVWKFSVEPRARLRNRVGYAAWHWYMRPALRIINRYRKRWKLRPLATLEDTFSTLAQISQLCPEFDFPGRNLPANFHYIGSLATDRQVKQQTPFPWEQLDDRPLIFASLGTINAGENLAVFHRIAAACAGLDAQLVMALGKWKDKGESPRSRLGKLPGDPIVADFAPQPALLDRASLLVTHAGVNTVLEALNRGVPMVAMPRAGDQMGMAARMEHCGAGLCGSFRRTTPKQLRRMIERVLSEECFRRRSREVGQAMSAAGGVQRAADIAERVLSNGQPAPDETVMPAAQDAQSEVGKMVPGTPKLCSGAS
jgi:MGT family glycosyltransferase